MNDNITVTECPGCKAEGRILKPETFMKTVISQSDYMKCPMCQGSGKVFVIPARIIGPATEGEVPK